MNSLSQLTAKLELLNPTQLNDLALWLDDQQGYGRGELKDCFVIMPFSETKDGHTEGYWTDFLEKFLTPALRHCGYQARRSETDRANVVEKIIQDLAWTDTVLAVLTDFNPTVWYELGVRHSLRKGTVMICQKDQPIPFDLKHHGIVFYEPSLNPTAFVKGLEPMLERIDQESDDSPISCFLSSGLVYCINKALAGRRAALEMLRGGSLLGQTPHELLAGVDQLDASWKAKEMQLTILKEDQALWHRDSTGRRGDELWRDTTLNCQSLYSAMKWKGTGINLGCIEGYPGRITAIAYDLLPECQWMVVAEAHVKQGGL